MASKFSWLVLSLVVLATSSSSSSSFVNGAPTKKGQVGVYELKKGNFSVKITNYGGHLMSVVFPDKYGKLDDVVLGYDTVQEYMNDKQYFGATVGRVANRIGGAQFKLNGTLYKLVANEGKNMLHGGPKGFTQKVWKVDKYKPKSLAPRLTLSYHSSDGEEGFPGDLIATVSYTLVGYNQLSIIMKAKALNKATPVNLVQHAYWNLGGQSSGDILSQQVQIFGSKFTPLDSQLIPTGAIRSVKGTPYDFLKPRTVGSRIGKLASGYDMNYVLDDTGSGKLVRAAVVYDKKSGRALEVLTNQPGVQFYTSNGLTQKGKGGFLYKPHAALCLETQGFPDAVNHPNFPSTIINPGKIYEHYLLLKFSAR